MVIERLAANVTFKQQTGFQDPSITYMENKYLFNLHLLFVIDAAMILMFALILFNRIPFLGFYILLFLIIDVFFTIYRSI